MDLHVHLFPFAHGFPQISFGTRTRTPWRKTGSKPQHALHIPGAFVGARATRHPVKLADLIESYLSINIVRFFRKYTFVEALSRQMFDTASRS